MRAPAWKAVVVALLCASAAAAPDDADLAKARATFDAISTIDPNGPSLTRRVRDYLALDRVLARKVEDEAWEKSSHSPYLENTLRFLHGMEQRVLNGRPRGDGLAVVASAVVWCERHPHGGNVRSGVDAADSRSYEELFGKHPPLDLPRAKPADMLAFPRSDPRQLPGRALGDFAQALGEACTEDDAGFTELAKRFDATPDDDLTIALGWSGRPAAVERLVSRCRLLGTQLDVEKDRDAARHWLASATYALHHADPAAFDALIGDLAVSRGDRVIAFLGEDALLRRRLAARDAASLPTSRRSALYRLCDLDAMRDTGAWCGMLPAGDEGRRVLRALLEAVDSGEPELRRAALASVEWFLSQSAAGPEIGLRRLVEDADSGRVVLRRRSSDTTSMRASSTTSGAGVTVRWLPEGLGVRIENTSGRPFVLNATALRHATAIRTTADYRGDPNGEFLRVSFDEYFLSFPASSLVLVPALGVQEVVLPMRAEFRGAAHVELTLRADNVPKEPPAPYLRFDKTLDL